MTEIADAVREHLLHCGFISYDDGTVALFKGSFAVGEDSVTPVVWTSAEKLVEALLARFEIRDRQVTVLPASNDAPPRRCPARVPEGNVITEGRQCQQYEGHAHDHTWYGDNGTAYSYWRKS